jgi:hypothetical protein
MDRTLQYLFGGVASSALIAAAVAAFISITALVANSGFPDGSSVAPPPGPQSVRVGDPNPPAEPGSVVAPTGPVAIAVPAALQSTLSSSQALRQLAFVRRDLTGNASGGSSTGHRHQASSSAAAHHPSPGSIGTGPSKTGTDSGTPPLTATPTPAPDSSSPGLAKKPAGLSPGQAKQTTTSPPSSGSGTSSSPPGLASKPGGLPPGLAKKPGGTPPGLASKPGGVPPGQAKKH